jgi:cytochrome c oxidase assembly protein subunit 11
VFCEITGLNGKTSDQAAEVSQQVDTGRMVKVQFVTHKKGALPWEFEPAVKSLMVYPGEMHQVDFNVTNLSANDMVVQAVPSVAPGMAATYFNKIECFCFNRQPLEKGQTAALGLQFYVDKDLPEDYSTVTLSYTLFDISDKIEENEFDELFAATTDHTNHEG